MTMPDKKSLDLITAAIKGEGQGGKHGRREFLARSGKLGALLLGAAFIEDCKQSGEEYDDGLAPKPLQVILYPYSISEGPLGASIAMSAMTMTSFVIAASSLPYGGVFKNIAILRARNNGSVFGKYKGSTSNGSLSVKVSNAEAPGGVIEYDLLLPSTRNGVDYAGLENKVNPGGINMFRSIRHVDRGQTGPEQVLRSAVDQVNAAMNPFGIPHGRIDWKSAAESSDMECGFGPGGRDTMGWHQDNWWVVNTTKCTDDILLTAIGIAEHFELINGTDDIYSRASSAILQYDGVVTPKGADIIAYFAARTNK